MDKVFDNWREDSLVWMPERGMGYFPVNSMPYDEGYFRKYQSYDGTKIGDDLFWVRSHLVLRHYQGPVLDVGIGSGRFVASRPNTFGYDVNPAGVSWLKQRGLFRDLYDTTYGALCFWDSLEHIPHPDKALAQAREYVFVSLPIFEDVDHVLRSKHYRKDEHYWYFTSDGFVKWMHAHGFVMLETNSDEVAAGREDIRSFAFRRNV